LAERRHLFALRYLTKRAITGGSEKEFAF